MLKQEISPAVIVVAIVVLVAIVALVGWRALSPSARGGGQNPYQNIPASARGQMGSQGSVRPMSGGPMSGGPMTGAPMSGGPTSGGPTSGGPTPQSGGAPAGGQ